MLQVPIVGGEVVIHFRTSGSRRLTHCRIYQIHDDGRDLIGQGDSQRCKRDLPDPGKGRQLAMARAMKDAKLMRSEREKIWQHYQEAYPMDSLSIRIDPGKNGIRMQVDGNVYTLSVAQAVQIHRRLKNVLFGI